MLESIKKVLRERKKNDTGFSLVELAVVIVIIGILVAIAVPIFANMQTAAKQANVEAAAANGSAIVASNIAAGATDIEDGLGALVQGDVDSVELLSTAGSEIDDYCVIATGTGDVGSASKGASTAEGCNVLSWDTVDAGGDDN